MSRKAAREIALHSIYEQSYNARTLQEICDERFDPEVCAGLAQELGAYKKPLEQRHAAYLRDVLRNIPQKFDEIDSIITKYSRNWNLRRISRVTTAILRISVYELLFCGDIPPKVSINEAVELAKKYDTEESAAFINGILASVFANEAVIGVQNADPAEPAEPNIEEPDEDIAAEDSSTDAGD